MSQKDVYFCYQNIEEKKDNFLDFGTIFHLSSGWMRGIKNYYLFVAKCLCFVII